MGGFERVSDPIVSRDLIGRRSDEVLVEVERGAIRKFAEAVGDTTEACLRGEVAPPTFPTTIRIPVPGLTYDAFCTPARSIDSSGRSEPATACVAGPA